MAKKKSNKKAKKAEKAKAKSKLKEEAKQKPKGRPDEKKRSRVLVRMLGTDLDGEKPIKYSLLKIKGVGHSFANALCKSLNIDMDKKLGSYTENEVEELETKLRNSIEHGIPEWMINRRKDIETGKNMHLMSSDVIVSKKFDIQRLVDKQSYKGVRHMLGLPVRGQRTKSSFRRGKTVGVVRKASRMQQQKKGSKKK